MADTRHLLRDLPAVDRLLLHKRTQALFAHSSREYVVHHCRRVLDEIRADIRAGRSALSPVSTSRCTTG